MKTKKNITMKDVVELQNKVWEKEQEVREKQRKLRHIETQCEFVELDIMTMKNMKQIQIESKKMQKEIEAEAQKKTSGLTLFVIAMNIILILSVIL